MLATGLVLCVRYRRWVATAIGVISGGIGLTLLMRAARIEVRGEAPFEGLGKGLMFLAGALLTLIAFIAVIAGLVKSTPDASEESSKPSV